MLYICISHNRENWVTKVKNILYRYGFGEVFIAQEVGDETYFMSVFKQRISDCAKQEWYGEITASSKLDNYCTFKSLLEPEKYLNVIHIRKFVKALSRFRVSNHYLEIEKGR